MSPGKFSITEVKFASFTVARNHHIQEASLKHWGKYPLLILQSLYNLPSPLVCVIQTQLQLLPAAFMGGISMNCVGNDPTQAEGRQDDQVLLGFFLLAMLADIICGITLNSRLSI